MLIRVTVLEVLGLFTIYLVDVPLWLARTSKELHMLVINKSALL